VARKRSPDTRLTTSSRALTVLPEPGYDSSIVTGKAALLLACEPSVPLPAAAGESVARMRFECGQRAAAMAEVSISNVPRIDRTPTKSPPLVLNNTIPATSRGGISASTLQRRGMPPNRGIRD
jgi:hypothetical protein